MENNFSTDQGRADGFQMIQANDIYCELYFYYDFISSTSDNQALDPRGCGIPDPSEKDGFAKGQKALRNS